MSPSGQGKSLVEEGKETGSLSVEGVGERLNEEGEIRSCVVQDFCYNRQQNVNLLLLNSLKRKKKDEQDHNKTE